MKSRLEEVPVYSTEQSLVEGFIFNQVRLGLKRLQNPLRMQLSGLRELDIHLEDDAWICVDRTLNDLPVLAWVDFDAQARQALHTPIACTLNLYNANADGIVDQVLELLSLQLTQRLKPEDS